MWHRMRSIVLALGLLAPGAAMAQQEEVKSYVASNLLAIFYHEIGHALVDVMQLPIFGQEEDAADVLSILMIHDLFEEEAAVQMTYDTAWSFWADSQAYKETVYWDVHGPDLQRYYTTVCLFVGGNIEEREDIAQDLELPEERLETCEEEFALAYDSWGAVMDDITVEGGGESLVFNGEPSDDPLTQLTYEVIRDEVEALNEEFVLPIPVNVFIEACGEPNAFYDPSERAIIMCAEFAHDLAERAPEY